MVAPRATLHWFCKMIASIAGGGVALAAAISAIQIMARNDSTPLWIVAGTASVICLLALLGMWLTRPEPHEEPAARGDAGLPDGHVLNVGVHTINAVPRFVEADKNRVMGGWLYVADLEITNREPRAVSLHLSLVVRLISRSGSVSRMTLEASYVSAAEIDDWLNVTKRLTELGPIDHLPNPIPIDPDRSRRGYVAFLLPSHMIPRHGAGMMETGEMLSEYAPDSDVLIVEDSVSEKSFRIEPWGAFRMQSLTREMNEMMARVRSANAPPNPPSTPDTSGGQR